MSLRLGGVPTGERLAFLVIVSILAVLMFMIAVEMRPQARNLRALQRHIDSIELQWQQFTMERDFARIKLYAYTGEDGLLGVHGPVPTEERFAELVQFLEGTQPPRPLYLNGVEMYGREAFDAFWPGED